MPAELPLDQLLASLETAPGALVTPSARAAAFLRAAYNRRQQAAGRTIWTPAPILSWQQWLSCLWTRLLLDGHEVRLLLNPTQEALLWRDIIAADRDLPALASPESLGSLAQSAFALAASYRTETRLRRPAASSDARIFAAWADTFLRTCTEKRYLPAAQLELAIETHLRATHLTAPAQLILCNFLHPTPTQSSFLATLEESGTLLSRLTAQGSRLFNKTPTTTLHATATFPTEPAEHRAAIAFLRDHLLAGQTAALIVPDPAAERPLLEPDFRDLLAPELNDIAATAAEPWTFATPTPLAAVPAVATLLDLLHWLRAPLPISRISALLLSPHFAGDLPLADRARFDTAHLQRTTVLRPELSLQATLALARRHSPAVSRALDPLAALSIRLNGNPPRRTWSEWTESLREAAHAAQWPAPEAQPAAEAFDSVLDLIATLDFTNRRPTIPEALATIERQTRQAPAPTHDAPLQILTLDQAAGIPFDAAVVLRATADNLPPRPHPHALLDWQLQRDLRMPGADPGTDLARTRETIQQLLNSTPEVLFTSAAETASGPTHPSTISSAFQLQSIDFTNNSQSITCNPQPTELHPDTAPLPPPPTEVRGGARVLQLQAACGFLAFAELRLGSREPESPRPGLDPLEAGRFLHNALESFWNEVQSQANLRALSSEDRQAAIARAVDSAFHLSSADPWDAAFLDVLRTRMARLLHQWLAFELDRAPFTVIATEQSVPITAGPLQLSVRLDRIDRVGDGFVVIDYKTGARIATSAWDGDRPDEPQLPLYTLAGDPTELRGLAFARLRAGRDMSWLGLADPGVFASSRVKPDDLAIRSAEWRGILDALAHDFYNGANAVSPKDYAINCKYCAQRLLCRVDRTTLLAHPAEEAADAEESDV